MKIINTLENKEKIIPVEKETKKIEVVKIDTEKPIDTFLSVNEILAKKKTINEDKDKSYINEKMKEDNVYSTKCMLDEDTNRFNDEISDTYKAKFENEYSKNSIEDTSNISENYPNYDVEIKEDEQQKFFENNENRSGFSLDDYNIIGTIFDTYIILSKDKSMYLLDQHVAHERVLYERYMDKFYKSDINMQMLLNPSVIEISNVDMLKVEENLDLFNNFGFEIDIFGNNHIMIRCVPTLFGVPESEKFILQIIDNIDEIKNNYELKGEKFASMACRSAIKANDKINTLEIKSLFEQMKECKNPFTCPHGRPIIVEISKTEIEKMFKRIM
ncbi:MAG: hypothetical protein RSE41_08130 [Clostridia bacterium]